MIIVALVIAGEEQRGPFFGTLQVIGSDVVLTFPLASAPDAELAAGIFGRGGQLRPPTLSEMGASGLLAGIRAAEMLAEDGQVH